MTSSSRPSNRSTEVSLVCFDLGGVLVRICRSWEEGCAAAGIEVRGASADETLKDERRRLTSKFSIGAVSSEEWARSIAEATGGLYSVEEIVRIHDAWIVDEYHGVCEVIDRIKATGRTVACLSNTNHDHWIRLVQHAAQVNPTTALEFPAIARLDHHFASHLLGLAKPDPAIYRAFEEQTGVHGEAILFFDDLEENVAAARRVGWRAEQIDHTSETAPQIVDHLQRHGVNV